MDNTQSRNETLVFGLDIGTRSIVGVVGYMERNRFKVIAMAEQKHETRAMLDGQIHDIYKVGDTIRKVKNSLENQMREEKDLLLQEAILMKRYQTYLKASYLMMSSESMQIK